MEPRDVVIVCSECHMGERYTLEPRQRLFVKHHPQCVFRLDPSLRREANVRAVGTTTWGREVLPVWEYGFVQNAA